MNGVASTADFRRSMEDASGQDLGWFFAQWLTRSGVPQISGTWRYDSAAKQIVITMRQTQAGDTYRFSLGVGVTEPSRLSPALHQLQVTGRESTFSIPADAEPATVVLDPGVWLLAELGSFSQTR
jgi:aminopeptidase N